MYTCTYKCTCIRDENNSQPSAKICAIGISSPLVAGHCGRINVYSSIQLLGDRCWLSKCLFVSGLSKLEYPQTLESHPQYITDHLTVSLISSC